ncbi:MAG: GLPGLI family protein [Bacteroidota bacterium]
MTRVSLHQLAVLVLLALPTLAASAQQGTVTYTATVKLDNVDLPPEFEALRDQIPSETSSERVLRFTETEALTSTSSSERESDVADPSELTETGEQRVHIRVRGAQVNDQTYVDLDTGEIVRQRDFLGRAFRIQREAEPLAWRLTGEQSEFLGYTAQKAVAEHDSTTYEAWFTPEIPVSAGPDAYGGLPGLILVLTAGNRTFEATSVDLSPLAEGAIEKPSEGQEVTSEEFARIVEERTREREASGTGRTRFFRF